jgi:DNA repair protein RadC
VALLICDWKHKLAAAANLYFQSQFDLLSSFLPLVPLALLRFQPRPAFASVLLSWLPQVSCDASFGRSGQTMLQVTSRPVPPRMHSDSLGSLAPLRSWVPRENKGQKRRKNIMSRKRTAYNRTLFRAIEAETTDNPITLTRPSSGENSRNTGQPDQEISNKYIPVYHIELVRDRLIKVEPKPSVHNPDDVVTILRDELLKSDREKLVCLFLNAKNVIIGIDVVSIGSLTASIAHPREIFKAAILKNAASIILSHGHPSGDPSPSREDIQLTERITKAGEILGIKLLDHIIIAEQGSYSFTQAGRLT